ncbi:MAG: signal peptidase I [Lachnospiraceae bacterium]|nr:signal peptidase I [Lachnospiraceae bacterium]
MKNVRSFVMEILLTLLILVLSGFLFAIARGYHPTVAGYQVLRVLSGSMSPVLEENDLILIRRVAEDQLDEGDIITFLSDDPYLSGIYNTHRIHRIVISEETGEKSYITKGDVNEMEDFYPVSYEQIAGKYITTLPYGNTLGKALSAMAGSKVFFFVIMLPLMLCLLSYLWQIFFILVIERTEEDADLPDEGEGKAEDTDKSKTEGKDEDKTESKAKGKDGEKTGDKAEDQDRKNTESKTENKNKENTENKDEKTTAPRRAAGK